MNLENHEQPGTATIDIDLIFQDSCLLVIELREGVAASESGSLRQECVAQVEGVRNALQESGMSARSIDLISHAQCALLDEVVLANARDCVRHAWINEPLQARFFGHNRAGETLYEEMRQVLHEPAPDPHVLTIYQRVMMLGFLGGHRTLDAEERMTLMQQLNARAEPQTQELPSLVIDGTEASRTCPQWLRSPVLHLAGAGLVLAVMWWLLNRSLGNAVIELAQGAV